MIQPEAAAVIKQWMERFSDAVCQARVVETSAGAGPGRDYAYLHFRTTDDTHAALVLRATLVDGQPEVRVVALDADAANVRDLVDKATHGPAPMPSQG